MKDDELSRFTVVQTLLGLRYQHLPAICLQHVWALPREPSQFEPMTGDESGHLGMAEMPVMEGVNLFPEWKVILAGNRENEVAARANTGYQDTQQAFGVGDVLYGFESDDEVEGFERKRERPVMACEQGSRPPVVLLCDRDGRSRAVDTDYMAVPGEMVGAIAIAAEDIGTEAVFRQATSSPFIAVAVICTDILVAHGDLALSGMEAQIV